MRQGAVRCAALQGTWYIRIPRQGDTPYIFKAAVKRKEHGGREFRPVYAWKMRPDIDGVQTYASGAKLNHPLPTPLAARVPV